MGKHLMISEGSFVTSVSNFLGIGKILSIDIPKGKAVVEYFDSPTSVQRPLFESCLEDLRIVQQLEPETRVYFYDRESTLWRMGRLMGHVDDDCFVKLSNGDRDRIHQSEIYVRWKLPLADPMEHLRSMLTETPYFHFKRRNLAAHLVQQRAISRGLTALLAAPVFLEKHQLEVVKRVLTDPIQRYLLADEVGLGKTIEAGIIARQHILDSPTNHNVVVVVPSALVNQWRRELSGRCQIGMELGHNVSVLSYEDFTTNEGLRPNLLVVDEAHQITHPRWESLYARVREVSDPAECAKLLLLSATPVRGNESGFLALLHLLDPTLYRLDALEGFQDRVANRQTLADIFVTLDPSQNSYFLEQTNSEARNLFPNDARLQKLSEKLHESLSSSDSDEQERAELVSSLRIHLSETYRLDRRVLRNRRSEDIDGLLPGRDGLTIIHDEESVTAALEDVVDLWREKAAYAFFSEEPNNKSLRKAATEQFVRLLEAAWTSPNKLEEELTFRRSRLVKDDGMSTRVETALPSFDEELPLLDDLIARVRGLHQSFEAKLDLIATTSISRANQVDRVVVMCTDGYLADLVYERIENESDVEVFRCAPETEDPESWLEKGILVCDGVAEEGLNLQGGTTNLIHVDLPLSPNRIEQRMGRLDRIGVGKAVRSFALVPTGAAYFAGWLDVLIRSWAVFDRSIASLQYVVEDEMNTLRQEVLVQGASALQQSLHRLEGDQGVIAKEFHAIRNQDELDAINENPGEIDLVIDGIEDYERSADDFGRSLNHWLVDALGFIRVGESAPNDPVGRYHFRSPSRSNRHTLVSDSDFLHWYLRGLDEHIKHPVFHAPLSRQMTARRLTALKYRVGVARLGHPWIDAVDEHLRWDDRGTSVAVWRYTPEATPEAQAFFRFAAVVEVNRKTLKDWCSVNSWADEGTVLRLADAAFPPVVETLWVNPEFSAPNPDQLTFLERNYSKESGDRNIAGDRWEKVLNEIEQTPQSWSDMCEKAQMVAEEQLKSHSQLSDLIATSLAEHSATYENFANQLNSRKEALNSLPAFREQLDVELTRGASLHSILQDCIRNLEIRFDSVAVFFVSNQRLQ